jgi:diguanylate cyclase (GGDEF)-like protein
MISLPVELQAKLKACKTLPSIPAVVLEVLELCQSEEVGIAQVGKAILRDPALAAKVLKVANSPWYGVRSQITTLDRAVSILGINATLSLALSFSLVRNLQKSRNSAFDHQAYWKRSVITATASQEIGRWAKTASHDELFLGGLLENIGMLVLNEAVPESYGRLVASTKGDHALLLDLERHAYGSDHAEVGAWQLERWELPAKLQLAAASSHDVRGDTAEFLNYSRCISLAGFIADIWIKPNATAATALAREKSIELFDMASDQFEQILDHVARSLPEVTANLDVNIGNEEYIVGILDQARAALVELSLQSSRTAREIQIKAQYDNLTSLANRAYLNDILPRQFMAARESGMPLSVLFIDVDNFKLVNDSHGHRGGDSVLVALGRLLNKCTRGTDIVARYGGDEFVILLSNANEKISFEIAKRILSAVQSGLHPIDGEVEIPVSISIGCATMSSSSAFGTVEELIKTADRCLYAAKRGGRNRIVTPNQLSMAHSAADENPAVDSFGQVPIS